MRHFHDYYQEANAMEDFVDNYIYDDDPDEVRAVADKPLDGRDISSLDNEERESLMIDVHQFLED